RHDLSLPVDPPGVSIDSTGQVGTYFYTAPEIEQGWPKIDEKGELPPAWVAQFPEQESLVRRLISPSPSDRPSATELGDFDIIGGTLALTEAEVIK
ncbi:hypothetical protein PIB30_096870, partial [Stylosanthes scabra]|nr:hypothetical protein [Stylosanthes scabra]